MALYYDLPVFHDVYQMILLLFQYTKNFPREFKFTLGQDIKRDGLTLVRSIYRANKAQEKERYLEEFLDDFELLKFEVRLAAELRLFTIKQHAQLTTYFSQIGKQIIGWRNASR